MSAKTLLAFFLFFSFAALDILLLSRRLEAKIQSDYGEFDYLTLAEDCFEAWVQFLRANGASDAFFAD